jgi:tetratricopeptide (TPR) repeat protein
MHVAQHYKEYIKQAKAAEDEGAEDEAITFYERAIKQKPLLEQPYARLMVLYRKKKQYEEELKVINKALEVFTGHYDKKKKTFQGSAKVASLSKAILKVVGGSKAAIENRYPQPIPKWMARKKIVEKKIK